MGLKAEAARHQEKTTLGLPKKGYRVGRPVRRGGSLVQGTLRWAGTAAETLGQRCPKPEEGQGIKRSHTLRVQAESPCRDPCPPARDSRGLANSREQCGLEPKGPAPNVLDCVRTKFLAQLWEKSRHLKQN